MSPSFRLVGLPYEPFADLFDCSDAELAERDIVRRRAGDEAPGLPCRVSLQEAQPGDELLLLPFAHQRGSSPYRASGPIFVKRNAVQATLAPGEVPPYVTNRLISVRAYDALHLIVDAAVCEGPQTAGEIERLFASPEVSYIHLHNAKRGCFACRVERA